MVTSVSHALLTFEKRANILARVRQRLAEAGAAAKRGMEAARQRTREAIVSHTSPHTREALAIMNADAGKHVVRPGLRKAVGRGGVFSNLAIVGGGARAAGGAVPDPTLSALTGFVGGARDRFLRLKHVDLPWRDHLRSKQLAAIAEPGRAKDIRRVLERPGYQALPLREKKEVLRIALAGRPGGGTLTDDHHVRILTHQAGLLPPHLDRGSKKIRAANWLGDVAF